MDEARGSIADLPTRSKEPHSSSLSDRAEATIVAFRKYTLPCCRSTTASMRFSRRSRIRLARHCIAVYSVVAYPDCSNVECDKAPGRKFERYPIGYVHFNNSQTLPIPGPRSTNCNGFFDDH
ncbi:transposase (class I) [Nitrobacter winogradskyi Nb-255]|uniref:Transposase (Class I) n=1 Tax=Nitrobacter winogradskyi (strain ATCC 25391 / DSM 10237 / CIP 104748 / NCIMB 11846 / Nb-255) TaxID=323098 RepID=Q3SUJ5_NITWN|nr:transposase (class I) [Nitrobacter winogradskyi Nb-255]